MLQISLSTVRLVYSSDIHSSPVRLAFLEKSQVCFAMLAGFFQRKITDKSLKVF